MKANAPKRKIFNDAVDLISTGEQSATGSGVEMLDIDSIKSFRNHPFHLYERERLNDMVESIKKYSVLGQVVTIDAMGTQTAIVEKIRLKRGDYVLALKENQKNLYEDVRLFLDEESEKKKFRENGEYKKTVEKRYGQIEIREYY